MFYIVLALLILLLLKTCSDVETNQMSCRIWVSFFNSQLVLVSLVSLGCSGVFEMKPR